MVHVSTTVRRLKNDHVLRRRPCFISCQLAQTKEKERETIGPEGFSQNFFIVVKRSAVICCWRQDTDKHFHKCEGEQKVTQEEEARKKIIFEGQI